MEEAFVALERFPKAPLWVYNWDCYQWVWEDNREGTQQKYNPDRGQEYDYVKFGELCRRAKEVWVPSLCTGKRTSQWWRIDNWHIIRSSCPWWDYDNVRDEGYVLCTLRHLPDPFDRKFESACQELKIPYMRTDHQLSYEEYQDKVAGCKFLVNHFFEASTGGLTLMEGYYLGKHCLCNASPWNGAKDYLGDRAHYFAANDYDDFKNKLDLMYAKLPKLDRTECSTFIKENFSDLRMVDEMMARIRLHVN